MKLFKLFCIFFSSLNVIAQEGSNYLDSVEYLINAKSSERSDLNLKDKQGSKYVIDKNKLLSADLLYAIGESASLEKDQIFRTVISNWYLIGNSFCIITGHKNKQGLEVNYRFYFISEDGKGFQLKAKGTAPQIMTPNIDDYFKSKEFEYLSSWSYKPRIVGANELGVVKLFSLEYRKGEKTEVIDIFGSSLREVVEAAKGYDTNHREALFKFYDFNEILINSFGCLKLP